MTALTHGASLAGATERVATPRIYVACLAAYNAGLLHGEWIDAAHDAEELHAAIQAVLATSPIPGAEEWAIHDYEGFGGLALGESERLDTVAELARCMAEYGDAYALYAGNVGLAQATVDGFLEAYQGEALSEVDYAQDLFAELHLHAIPEPLRAYIDYPAFARDLFLDGYWSARDSTGTLHIFREC